MTINRAATSKSPSSRVQRSDPFQATCCVDLIATPALRVRNDAIAVSRSLGPAILVAICLSLSLNAFALEQSSSIKVSELLKTANTWDGSPIIYPQGKAEITGLLVEFAPGAETGWHLHPVPSFGMILEGTLEVTLEDGRVRRLQPGDALAEVVNTIHSGRNVGDTPVKLVVFYAGTVGGKTTIRQP